MKIKKILSRSLVLAIMLIVSNQTMAASGTEFLFSNGRIFVVYLVVLVILLGLFVYLFRMDKKLKDLEKEMRNRSED